MSFKRRPPADNVRRTRTIGLNHTGIVINKNGRVTQYESFAERLLILTLERDPTVLDYVSQPESFHYSKEGRIHKYTPDFKVWRQGGSIEIHEVTRSERQNQDLIISREQAARSICSERGWKYVVHNEQTLPGRSEQANLLALFCYRATVYLNLEIMDAAVAHLSSDKRMPLSELSAKLARTLNIHESTVIGSLSHMLWKGILETDMKKLIFIYATPVPGALIWLSQHR
jgi:hypothetical protein